MKSLFWKLEKLGRIQLSENFYLRQFLYSEIGIAFGIPNIPDNEDLAIETGTKLCENILEPLTAEFGPIVIRSGFRSAALNAHGKKFNLMCSSNERNYAYHIWDHRDEDGYAGAAACIVIPAFNDGKTRFNTWQDLAWHIHNTLPYHRLTFFSRNNAFNIGWHENPKREVYSLKPNPHWLVKG